MKIHQFVGVALMLIAAMFVGYALVSPEWARNKAICANLASGIGIISFLVFRFGLVRQE